MERIRRTISLFTIFLWTASVQAASSSWSDVDAFLQAAAPPAYPAFANATGLPPSTGRQFSPTSPPSLITEMENGVCGTWTFENGPGGSARWENGALATVTVKRLDDDQIEITRTDNTDSVSPGLTATYSGKRNGDRVYGTVTWNRNGTSTGTGNWSATFEPLSLDETLSRAKNTSPERGFAVARCWYRHFCSRDEIKSVMLSLAKQCTSRFNQSSMNEFMSRCLGYNNIDQALSDKIIATRGFTDPDGNVFQCGASFLRQFKASAGQDFNNGSCANDPIMHGFMDTIIESPVMNQAYRILRRNDGGYEMMINDLGGTSPCENLSERLPSR